jgi:hypothetical protein
MTPPTLSQQIAWFVRSWEGTLIAILGVSLLLFGLIQFVFVPGLEWAVCLFERRQARKVYRDRLRQIANVHSMSEGRR